MDRLVGCGMLRGDDLDVVGLAVPRGVMLGAAILQTARQTEGKLGHVLRGPVPDAGG